MNGSTARTILSLNDQRDEALRDKRAALLDLAELKHELADLKSMKADILVCLLDYRIPGSPHPDSLSRARHTISSIERIIRNGKPEQGNAS